MPRAIAARVHGLFDIQGHPHPEQHGALSTKKLKAAPASFQRVDLGFLIDTRQMTVTLPDAKRALALRMLTAFNPPRRSVSLREVARLVGTLTHLCTISHWGQYHFTALTHSVKVALRLNRTHLRLQSGFSHWVATIADKAGSCQQNLDFVPNLAYAQDIKTDSSGSCSSMHDKKDKLTLLINQQSTTA